MSDSGCRPSPISSPTPLNLPLVLDLPSTSNDNIQKYQKLPLYGPLDIRNYEDFLNEQKVFFHESYKEPSTKVNNLNEYQNLYILGRGNFSKIIVAQSKAKGKYYALKIYHKELLVQNNLVEKVLEEKRILQSLDCPFCIRLHYLYQDILELFLVLPFVSGGSIFTHLQRARKFDEGMSLFYAAQIVLALEYMHCCNLVYRSLTPENLHLDHFGYLKITKFSSAKIVATKTFTICGTPEYLAPEIIAGKGYGKSVDWWAFGVLLYELNEGYPPFISANASITHSNITAARYTMPSSFSRELQDLISRLLQPDVTRRAGDFKGGCEDIKNHDWFEGLNWMNILNRQIDPPFLPRISGQSVNYPSLAITGVQDPHPKNFDEYFKDF